MFSVITRTLVRVVRVCVCVRVCVRVCVYQRVVLVLLHVADARACMLLMYHVKLLRLAGCLQCSLLEVLNTRRLSARPVVSHKRVETF